MTILFVPEKARASKFNVQKFPIGYVLDKFYFINMKHLMSVLDVPISGFMQLNYFNYSILIIFINKKLQEHHTIYVLILSSSSNLSPLVELNQCWQPSIVKHTLERINTKYHLFHRSFWFSRVMMQTKGDLYIYDIYKMVL